MQWRSLVVDDYAHMRRHLVQLLDGLGLSTIEAECGVDALEMLKVHEVDVVFTDLVMPEMDGLELCEELRRRSELRHLPIIVASTHRDASYVIEALQRGADDYIQKPANERTLRRVLERVSSSV